MASSGLAIRQVAVIGAGLMGHGIGLVHAFGGCEVTLHDLDAAVLGTALSRSRAAGMALVEAGLLGQGELDWALERLHIESDPARALAGADMVVEAIVEEAEAKRAAFAKIDRHAPQEAIIASNTSYLDVFPLIPARRQARTLIVHWYAPPHAIDLVDVVRGPETEDGLAEAVCALLSGFGKKPVLMLQFVHGYIANRIQTAISLEVFHLLDAGVASAEDIDAAIRYGIAQRLTLLGHLGRLDFAGLKVTQLNLSNKAYNPPPVRGRSDTVDRLVAEGRLGVTAGAGFYDYGGRSAEDLFRERDRKLFALKRAVERIEHVGDMPEESNL
jgi:3-hydroxybutyryl-CoA dehydrogenase